MDNKLIDFHKQIDQDNGLKSKRRSLIITSLVLIVICWTGSTIKEYTGLIAKIEISNAASVRYLLILSIIYLMFRYFAYARTYHSQLRSLWLTRFMKDKEVFNYIPPREGNEDNIDGLLGKALNVWVYEEPSVRDLQYKNHRTILYPFFGRKITYLTKSQYLSGDPDDPKSSVYEQEDTNEIYLYKFTEQWKPKDYIKLLLIEFRYVLKSYTHHREYFDLMGPYFFGIFAIISYFIAPHFLSV